MCKFLKQFYIPSVLVFLILYALPQVWAGEPTDSSSEQQAEAHHRKALDISREGGVTKEEILEAIELEKMAYELSPQTFKYAFNLGALSYQVKNWTDAGEWFLEAADLAQSDSESEIAMMWLKKSWRKMSQPSSEGEMAGERTDAVRRKLGAILKGVYVEMEDRPKLDEPVLPEIKVGEPFDPLRIFLRRLNHLNAINKDVFVLVGRYREEELEEHYRRGLEDAYRFLKHEYFPQGPQRLITVFLSDDPYDLITDMIRIYDDPEIRVYEDYVNIISDMHFFGCFIKVDNLMAATIAGGYGTLLHELMHALIASDYPDAPSWLNEAMAMLYERSKWTPSRLVALPNWRMEFINEHNIGSLADFDRILQDPPSDRDEFAQMLAKIRLLMLFLDSKELVNDFYKAAKEKGDSFVMSEVLNAFGEELSEQHWERFVWRSITEYEIEWQESSGSLSYRDTLFVQKALNRLIGANLEEDGVWGSQTKAKVIEYQRKRGLKPDGIVGSKTMALIENEFALANLTP